MLDVPEIKTFQFSDYKSLNHLSFQQAILEVVLKADEVLHSEGIDKSFEEFLGHLRKVIDEHLPLEKLHVKKASEAVYFWRAQNTNEEKGQDVCSVSENKGSLSSGSVSRS